jgi:hypothetical protein
VGLSLIAGCGPSTKHASGSTPSKKPTAAAACHLQVLGSGVSVVAKQDLRRGDGWWGLPIDDTEAWYGFLVKNPCKQVAVAPGLEVRPVDKSGNTVFTDDSKPVPAIPHAMPNIPPGRTVGFGGVLRNRDDSRYDPSAVASVKVQVDVRTWRPTSSLNGWAFPTVGGVSVGAASGGLVPVSFTVRSAAGGSLHSPMGIAVYRDANGRVVSSASFRVRKLGRQSVKLAIPSGADATKTQVFVLEGSQSA